MGTVISLDICGIGLDWAKNHRGSDHGILFQEKDRKRIRSEQINYEYFAEIGEEPALMEMAFCTTLREVLPRLYLQGFSIDQAHREYTGYVESWGEYRSELQDGNGSPEALSFSEFSTFVAAHSLGSLNDTYVPYENRESDQEVRGRFVDDAFIAQIPHPHLSETDAYSERTYFGHLIDFLHPYSVLCLLAQNPANLNCEVVWQYGPLVAAGWAKEDEFVPGVGRYGKFLIATEGSSDTHIISHALSLLRPDVADFFRFIDVSESHPFSGTGDLVKFGEGLVKIDVQNQILFILDNDAVGYEAFKKLSRLRLPANMRAMMLPEIEQFREFPTIGPEGESIADINRRAAAIECYLDHRLSGYPPARVRWTNFNKGAGDYQGALEHKEMYMRHFLGQKAESLTDDSYDISKLLLLIEALVAECGSIANDSRKPASVAIW